MAYCVECGVKLEEGATSCPLCHRKVHAPKEIIGISKNSLFDSIDENERVFPSLKYDKRRKGLIELSLTFVGVAIVTLLITSFVLDGAFSPWFAIACTVLGSGYLFILLFSKLTYMRIATLFSIHTIITLFTIDVFNASLGWSLFAMNGVALFYLIGVFPFNNKIKSPIKKIGIVSAGILVSLFLFDFASGNSLTWFFPIALPTFLVTLACFAFLVLRYVYGNPSLSDIVLSIILNVSLGTVAGNFFSLRMIHSPHLLTWSVSVLIVSIILALFLLLNATIRKVRFYFTNKIR